MTPGWIRTAQRPLRCQDYFTIHSGACECTKTVPIFYAEFAAVRGFGGLLLVTFAAWKLYLFLNPNFSYPQVFANVVPHSGRAGV